MFSRLAIAMALTFTTLLTACGPEKSTDELMQDERDRQEKVSRERLLEQADRQLPNIRRWEGCYQAKYYYEGGTRTPLVKLERWIELVTPGTGTGRDLDPVEMPILRASLHAGDGGGRFHVGFNKFSTNIDATYIRFTSESGLGVGATMEFIMDAQRKHEGFYRGPSMPQAAAMTLEPVKETRCN